MYLFVFQVLESSKMSDESDVSSVVDFETADLEDDVNVVDLENDFFENLVDDDSNIYTSKCGTIEWTSNSKQGPIVMENLAENVEDFKFLIDIRQVKSPKDAFSVFWDDKVLETICKFTNNEAKSDENFKPLGKTELLAWMGIVIAAGKNHDSKTRLKDMWSSDEMTRRLFYSAVMGRHRYFLKIIHNFLIIIRSIFP